MQHPPSPVASDFSAIEELGYTVELTGNDNRPYVLHGPKGARYTLWRNANNRDMLFPLKGGGRTAIPKVRGYSWFTDRDGKLRPH